MIERSNKKIDFIISAVYFSLIAGIVYIVFNYVLSLIMPFIIAFILVTLFNPIIKKIHKRMKINQKILSVSFMLLLYIAAGSLIFLVIMQLIFMLRDVVGALPKYYDDTIAPALNNIIDSIHGLTDKLPNSWPSGFETVKESILNGIQGLTTSISQGSISFITGFINGIPSFIMALIFTIMLSFFISLEYDKVLLVLKTQLPERSKIILKEVRVILKNTLYKYIKAYLILMSITFVELSIGLLILGTTSAIPVAAGIAVFDALPVFGTGGVMIPWIIIELVQGEVSYALGLGIIYGVITLVRNIIEPKVVGDQLGINPIISLVAIYLGFRLFGVLGMIAFPMLAQVLLVLHQNGTIKIYKEVINGESLKEETDKESS